MRRQIQVNQHREHHLSVKIRKLRRLIARLRKDQSYLQAALDTITQSVRGVESAAMFHVWRRMTSLKDRLKDARRAARRTRHLRRETVRRTRQLQIAMTRLFRVCPVDDPRSYVDDFGVLMRRDENGAVTTDKKKWHRHRGVDIFSVAGTPVRAPFSGWARVATNSVGGLAVKVFGAQGFVYNAHLTAYGHLGYVEENTIIGYVGNSGDARGTMAHDHFEWHPFNGPAVDPYPYLNEACL